MPRKKDDAVGSVVATMKKNTFIAWSGQRSKIIAEALNDWLPMVVQTVQPFISTEIDKGNKWSSIIGATLKACRAGVICLTPENQHDTWINDVLSHRPLVDGLYNRLQALKWRLAFSRSRTCNNRQHLNKGEFHAFPTECHHRSLRNSHIQLVEIGRRRRDELHSLPGHGPL
jgi:hypothetical protein